MKKITPLSHFFSFWHRLSLCLRTDIVLSSITINFLGLALPLVVLQLYDRVIPNGALQTLVALVVALVLALFLETLLVLCRALLMNNIGSDFEQKISLEVFKTVLKSDFSIFESKRHSDYLEKIKSIEQVRDIRFGKNLLSIFDLPFVIVFFFMIWIFADKLVLIPLLLFVTFIIFSFYIAHVLHKALIERDVLFERRHNFLLEVLQGMQTLKPLAMESQMLRRYERLESSSASVIHDLAYANNLIHSATSTFSQATMALFVMVGAIPAAQGDISIGALAAGTMLAGRVLQPASRVLSFWMQWQASKIAEDKLQELLSLPQEAVNNQSSLRLSNGMISIDNISFTYADTKSPTISNCSLTINAKKMVAISGASGSGKSTLLKLLVGLDKVQAGNILYDGTPLSNFNMKHLRQSIGYIPQQGALFNGNILENLTAFKSGSAIDEAIEYAKVFGLDNSITQMVNGLETEVSSSLADNMPVGLRQRIVMVRAILGDTKVILFDDANTGFDQNNTKKLVDFFLSIKGKKTVVIVTNQRSLINLCDESYVMKKGRLVNMSSHVTRANTVFDRGESAEYSPSQTVVNGGKFSG